MTDSYEIWLLDNNILPAVYRDIISGVARDECEIT